MAELNNLMTEYPKGSMDHLKGQFGWCLVYCPEFCESEYEICDLQDGIFISQANWDTVNNYVEMYTEIESYL